MQLPKRVTLFTDAWAPQANGVVRALEQTIRAGEGLGTQFDVVSPADFRTLPMPGYSSIPLALASASSIARIVKDRALSLDAIHIVTEGPVGWAARRYCLRHSIPFVTSYLTKFPEYVAARIGFGVTPMIALLRHFHRASERVLVVTDPMRKTLEEREFGSVGHWRRGIDTEIFRPDAGADPYAHLPRPVFATVGRVAVEKNIEAFLKLDLPGAKVVVGDGPQLEALRRAYPDVFFVGGKPMNELAPYYAHADVFVFPSLTDVFGNVLLEAIACGTPFAAFPEPGPLAVMGDPPAGAIDTDLLAACNKALAIARTNCLTRAKAFSWEVVARDYLETVGQACQQSKARVQTTTLNRRSVA